VDAVSLTLGRSAGCRMLMETPSVAKPATLLIVNSATTSPLHPPLPVRFVDLDVNRVLGWLVLFGEEEVLPPLPRRGCLGWGLDGG
jgi:hypothetical protein